MKLIQNFSQLTSYLKSLNHRRRVVVVFPHDPHTQYAIRRALEEGFVEFLLVVDKRFLFTVQDICIMYPSYVTVYETDSMEAAARKAVELVREGKADILMKGIINTDTLLKAVLNKEAGLLPRGTWLTHVTFAEVPTYHKLICFSDVAVIPNPTYEQFKVIIKNVTSVCRNFGIKEPKVALVHCSEKVNEVFPVTLDYVRLKQDALNGEFGKVLMDGPLDVKTACDEHSAKIKGIVSPVTGDADVLIFPDIEAGNTFYKTMSLFAKAEVAGMLLGATCPIIVTSRSDSSISKFYSLALACITIRKD